MHYARQFRELLKRCLTTKDQPPCNILPYRFIFTFYTHRMSPDYHIILLTFGTLLQNLAICLCATTN